VDIAFLLLIVAILLMLRSLSTEVKLLRTVQQAGSGRITVEPTKSGEATLTLSEFPDAMVKENAVQIVGEASDNIIISLMVNGDLRQVTLPSKGKFQFKDVTLQYGENEIIIRGTDKEGRTAILENLNTTFGNPRLDYLARDITRGDVTQNKIALTFDGGAGNGATATILDMLVEKGLRCTMFLTGRFIKDNPDLVKRMLKEGHEIANHTMSHPHMTTFAINGLHNTMPDISRETVHLELLETNELFRKITGQNMAPYWRAPYGEHNLQIRRWASEIGYTQVGWTLGHGENMDTMDWVADTLSSQYKSPRQILQKILSFGSDSESGANGCIILMHLDTQRKKDQPYEIIPALIDSLQHRGYKFVTVSQLIKS
jgi:peptidoglycan/xylan/chitin deacetylase (PgdA/CDA1 family)